MGKEEQDEELEVLASIFPDEISCPPSPSLPPNPLITNEIQISPPPPSQSS